MLLVGERSGGASAKKSIQSLKNFFTQKFRSFAYNCKAADGRGQLIVRAVKIYWNQVSNHIGILQLNKPTTTVAVCDSSSYLLNVLA